MESLETRTLLAGDFCIAMSPAEVDEIRYLAEQLSQVESILVDIRSRLDAIVQQTVEPVQPIAADEVIEVDADGGEPIPDQGELPYFEPVIPGAADDVFQSNGGNDTWLFKTVINAQPSIVAKHADENGVIDWSMNGVAGENDNVHDHWVEGFGVETILGFDEGDQIVVEGHTTYASTIRFGDFDNDGRHDDSQIILRSDQGGAGAHDGDRLGRITVIDYSLDIDTEIEIRQIDHGIVDTIDKLPVRDRVNT